VLVEVFLKLIYCASVVIVFDIFPDQVRFLLFSGFAS